MNRFTRQFSPSMAVALLALFIGLGGTGYAATQIGQQSASAAKKKHKQKPKIKLIPGPRGPQGVRGDPGPQGLQGAKGDAGPATGSAGGALAGTYPSPSLAAPEAYHVVGSAGEPGFLNGWVAFGSGYSTPGFYKDPLGVIHLKGTLKSGTSSNTATGDVFILPAGYRPAESQQFQGGDASGPGQIAVLSTGEIRALSTDGNTLLTIDGFTFRAGG